MAGADMPLGKVSPEIFDEVIFPRLGAPDPRVLVGPRHGVDAGIVRVAPGTVMAVTTDPFYIVPTYGWERAAWFAVHSLASDLATTALAPQQAAIDLNLPLAIDRPGFEALWGAVHDTCREIGVAVVTGHTARYNGCDWPMVGGATMWAFGPEDRYITPAMAQVGDAVLVTKGPAIETTGLLAATFRDKVAAGLGPEMSARAERVFWQMSCVEDARVAASVGVREDGVTAMHDATECGVDGGLYEIARASQVGMLIDRDRIPVPPEVAAVCRLFDINPHHSISEGTLLLTCRPRRADAVVAALASAGILAAVVGECRPAAEGMRVREHGLTQELRHPLVDPFWGAFHRAWMEMLGADAAE